MRIPAVIGHGDSSIEPFEDYLRRWPADEHVPKCLIEHWIHRHWSEFQSHWLDYGVLDWNYEKLTFSNEEILKIHTNTRMECTLDYWGDQLFENATRRDTWLAQQILESGTTPISILVLRVEGSMEIPNVAGAEMMTPPFHLVEGHMRTAYLRGMIKHQHDKLSPEHQVWVANVT